MLKSERPGLVLGLLTLLRSSWGASALPEPRKFQDYQRELIHDRLPQLPLQVEVFGSIFQTAYYFIDVMLGAPKPQSVSMIVDTGSSTQGIPCQDCEACGSGHWDPYYNRSRSDFSEKMPCGECTTCRLSTADDSLRALVPPLSDIAAESDAEFSNRTAKLLLTDPEKMQCLYHVHYAEGSSLSGLFYTDVVWLNMLSGDRVGAGKINDPDSCPKYPLSPGPSVPLYVPVGCHIEETHLFYEQKASGILGLEFWGTKGVPTFPAAVLEELSRLYGEDNLEVAACNAEDDRSSEQGNFKSDKFHYAFSMCLSPNGGVMSFGGPNRHFHLAQHRVDLNTDEALKFRAPIIVSPSKAPSYLIALTGIRITKDEVFSPDLLSDKLYHLLEEADKWDEVKIKPSITVRSNSSDAQPGDVKAVPALLDSGTTLTYLPTRLFRDLRDGITSRVATNSANRDGRERSGSRKLNRSRDGLSPRQVFQTEDVDVLITDELIPDLPKPNVIEYIPLTERPLHDTPKRLIRLNSLQHSSVIRTLRGKIIEEFQAHLAPAHQTRRRLQDSPPGWYAVLEPTADPSVPPEDTLVGFLEIPPSMEAAAPRALVSKLDGYNNGECWWLQDHAADMALFPTLAFEFYGNLSTLWHPESYLYSGTNDHFWCLAIMTDGSQQVDEEKDDDEIILGSNSFVHHDIVFAIEKRNVLSAVAETRIPSTLPLVPPLPSMADGWFQDGRHYTVHEDAAVYMIPAVCPEKPIEGRT